MIHFMPAQEVAPPQPMDHATPLIATIVGGLGLALSVASTAVLLRELGADTAIMGERQIAIEMIAEIDRPAAATAS